MSVCLRECNTYELEPSPVFGIHDDMRTKTLKKIFVGRQNTFVIAFKLLRKILHASQQRICVEQIEIVREVRRVGRMGKAIKRILVLVDEIAIPREYDSGVSTRDGKITCREPRIRAESFPCCPTVRVAQKVALK